jgi:hypothetical protein
MRSTFRRALVALLAVTAIGALVAASASAAFPEFKVSGGKFPTTFTGTSPAVHIQVRGGGGYTCTSSSITGEIVGPKEVAKVIIKFIGPSDCSGFCRQKTLEAWETKELKGSIGFIEKGVSRVGLLLEAAAEPIATCTTPGGRGTEKLQGSIIGELGPTSVMRKAFTLNYQQLEGRQNFRHFEGEEVLHDLQILHETGGTPIELGIETSMSLTTAKEVEIRT